MKLPLLITLVCCISVAHSQSKRQIRDQWNVREKDRLIEAVENNQAYAGVYYDSYHWIAHMINPGENGNYIYTKVDEFSKETCTYKAPSAQEVVSKIMDSYLNPVKGCQRTSLSKVDSTLNPDFLRYVGHKDGALLALTQHDNKKEEPYYQLHYLNQYGIGKAANEDRYTDTQRPLFIVDQKRMELKNNKVYINNGKKTFDLPVEIAEGLIQSANSRVDKTGSLTSFNMTSEALYASENQTNGISKVSLKNGKHELMAEKGFTPRIYNNHLYYFKPPLEDSKAAFESAGFFKENLKNGNQKKFFDGFVAEELGFQGISYIPISEEVIIRQIIQRWGGENYIGTLNLEKIDLLLSIIKERKEVRKELRELQSTTVAVAEPMDDDNEIVDNEEPKNKNASQIEALKKQAEEIEVRYKKVSQKHFKSYIVPEGYFMVAHPETQVPIFISHRPYWPVLSFSDIMEVAL